MCELAGGRPAVSGSWIDLGAAGGEVIDVGDDGVEA